MKRTSILFVLAVYFYLPSQGQNPATTVDALLLDSKYTEAIELINKSFLQTSDINTAIMLETKKAEALIRLGKFEEAGEVLKSAEQKTDKSPNTEFLKAIIQTNVGFLHLNQGRSDLALESLQNAVTQFELAGKGNSLEAAQAISYLGQTYFNTGKNVQAEEQLQRALILRQEKLKESHELIAGSYNDLGLVYSFQGDDDKALDYYEKALKIYETLHGQEHPKIAIANTNIGVVYRKMALYGDAVNNLETSLKIWEKVYPQAHPTKAFVLFNLGQTYLKMGDQKAALGYYDRALKIYQESYGKKHPDIANTLNAIGNIKLSQHQYTESLTSYQQALKANSSDFDSDDIRSNPKLRNFYNGNTLLYSMLFKAQAFEARYFGKTLKFEDLKLSLAVLHYCDTLIDKLRQQINNENDKISLGVIANEVYGDGVRIANAAALNAFKKKPFFGEAFYFAEKSKSAVLLEAISDSEAKSFAGIPGDLLEEEKNLKSAIALTAQKLAQKPTVEEEKYLRETSFNLSRSYATFIKKLETQFPEYFNLKFNSSSPSIAQLQSLLDDKTALLSYFIDKDVDEKNNRLYIFFVSRNKYRVIDHELPKDFDKYITGLRNGLFFNELNAFKLSSIKLYQLLIPAIPSSIKELVILPTGRLGIIPFETLLTKETPDEVIDYKTFPYLVKHYSIRYDFSAGLLFQKSKQKSLIEKPSIFLCAPVTFPSKENLNELPGTESEVKEISTLFAGRNLSNALFTKRQANEKLIKSGDLKNYNLLHFATHGVVDEDHPELSRIFLQTETEAEDGNLFAGEIYNLQLKANLVTLSACQTGLGKISKGEGVIGLSRALVYAGAKNVVVSFWSVADESTADLMQKFYAQLLGNSSQNYGEDLRKAKLSILNEGKYAAPYYWAPFILIGF